MNRGVSGLINNETRRNEDSQKQRLRDIKYFATMDRGVSGLINNEAP